MPTNPKEEQKYLLILTIILSLSACILFGWWIYKKYTKPEEDPIEKYVETINYIDSVVTRTEVLYKTIKIFDSVHIEKVVVIQKNLENEKEYIQSVNDNDVLRELGKRAVQRYNSYHKDSL